VTAAVRSRRVGGWVRLASSSCRATAWSIPNREDAVQMWLASLSGSAVSCDFFFPGAQQTALHRVQLSPTSGADQPTLKGRYVFTCLFSSYDNAAVVLSDTITESESNYEFTQSTKKKVKRLVCSRHNYTDPQVITFGWSASNARDQRSQTPSTRGDRVSRVRVRAKQADTTCHPRNGAPTMPRSVCATTTCH